MSPRRIPLALAGLVPLLVGCAGDNGVAPIVGRTQPSQIVYGSPDVANTYANVAAMIVRRPDGLFTPICTGTLIRPAVVVTAAHCTSYFENVLQPLGYTLFVSFRNLIAYGSKADAPTTASLIAVTDYVANPGYSQRQNDVGDVALLFLASAPAGVDPATLPTPGLLDQLAERNGLKDATFTVAGYGVQDRVVGGGTPFFTDENPIYRRYASESFLALNGGYLRLSQNPATGDAGACFGDSGGPNFLSVDGQPVLVALTITGDAVCRATNVVYRLDIPSAQAFLTANLP